MTVTPPTTIKRGDAVTLTLDLHADLTGYTVARVILAQRGRAPRVSRVGTIAVDPTTGIVTVDFSSDDTSVAGDYSLEVEMTPGPHTWPSDTWLPLRILPDLG